MSSSIEKVKYEKEELASDHVVEAYGGEDSGERQPKLKRAMKSRHISMISIGGVIGTGLFLGSGGALKNGGPLGLLLGYSIMGSVCFSVMIGLGEMISYLPIEGGHIALAHRFVDPAWAFALSFNYAFNWLIILPVEIAAVAVLVGYWDVERKIHLAVWMSIALVIIIVINLFGARGYAEAEFWFASIKVLTIIVLIFLGIAINCGAGPRGEYLGFRYWKNPGALNPGYLGGFGGKKSLAEFLGFWAVLTQAAFSYIGTEIVAITAGEAQNPRRNLPRAIKKVYIRILLFYIMGVFIIGIITPRNDPRLGTASNAAASPFVIAIERVGISFLPSLINACLITSAWSAGSSDLYTASRALYGIALNGDLPKIFTKTSKNGAPIVALGVSSLFGGLAYMGISAGPGRVFGWLANLTAIAGLASWFAISVTYIKFRKGMDAQGIDRSVLPYKSRFAKFGAYYACCWIAIASITSGWTVFLKGSWDTATFVTNYLPMAIFPVLFIGKKLYSKTEWRRAEELDFTSGLAEIIADEEEEVPATTWYGKVGQAIF